jgi:DNA-binding IclR family transcriptional regulator
MSRLPARVRHRLVHSLPLTRHTSTTIADPGQLLALLDETRSRGWAKTNEESGTMEPSSGCWTGT